MTKAILALVVGGVALLAAPAAASPEWLGTSRLNAEDRYEVRVRYSDLNLGAATGRVLLSRRIEVAVAKVCGRTVSGLRTTFSNQQCRTDSRKRVAPQLSSVLARHGQDEKLALSTR